MQAAESPSLTPTAPPIAARRAAPGAAPAPSERARSFGSFAQLLLIAFLLIAAFPGVVALRAVASFDELTARGDTFAVEALNLSTAVQLLDERSVVMERAARQSLALDDAVLRERFAQALRDSQETLATLNWSDVPARLISQWQAQLETITAAINQPGKPPAERDAQVAAAFRELAGTNTAIAQEARHTIEQRRLRLQEELKASRQRLTRLVAIQVVLALLLAVAVGVWLLRPFKRIERAILGMGENRLDQPIQINGPADVRRLGRQLEWLRLRLVQLDADKTRFLRHVSHEIKTPLAALTEGVALLEDGTAGSLSSDQREIARILSHNTQALQSQIEALLRFNAAAFDANRLQRVPTDLRLLIEQQVEAQRLQLQARAVQLRVEGPALVEPVDPAKFGMAIGNLLSNAIRFSPVGGCIWFRLSRHEALVCIEVEDQGPGIAESDRSRIFEPFYRGQRQSAEAPRGSGVGLSIVQEYVVAHGGIIQLLPDGPGSAGSRFLIELPHAD